MIFSTILSLFFSSAISAEAFLSDLFEVCKLVNPGDASALAIFFISAILMLNPLAYVFTAL